MAITVRKPKEGERGPNKNGLIDILEYSACAFDTLCFIHTSKLTAFV